MAKSDDELRQLLALLRERGIDPADGTASLADVLDVIGDLSLLDFGRLSEIARAEWCGREGHACPPRRRAPAAKERKKGG